MRRRFPGGDEIGPAALLEDLHGEPVSGRLTFGDPRVVDFLVRFARKLLAPAIARRYPELASLGFFLRRGEISKVLENHRSTPDAPRFPRGLVFHVPPANVDTIFVYSWALSALAGNHNVVRISPRSGGAAQTVLDALNEASTEADPVIARTQAMVTYDRDDEATATLSAGCDLRVVWGGDASVRAVRGNELAPHARDLTFPDRASFAVASVAGWLAASDARRRRAVEGFYNDSYWFDQAACSSPRTLFWVGDEPAAEQVKREFRESLSEVVAAREFAVEPAMAVQKRVSSYGAAAEGFAGTIRFSGNAVATMELTDRVAALRDWLGVGTFPQASIARLADLLTVVERRDQTLTHFGFAEHELRELATALGGRGIDRIVPFGSALSFSAIWDGYDLLNEFSRLTTVTV